MTPRVEGWRFTGTTLKRPGRTDITAGSGGGGGTTDPNYPFGAIGSYRPSASTTGPRTGVTLAQRTTNVTASTAGQVVENLDIHGKLSIQAADVIVRNCIIRGESGGTECINVGNANAKNALIEDCILQPEFPSRLFNGISGHDFTMRRCEIRDTVDFVGLWNSAANTATPGVAYQINVTIEQCWGHDMSYFTPDAGHADNQTHNDGIQFQGGWGAVVRGNSFEAYYGPNGSHQPSNLANPTPSGDASPSLSCLLFNNNVGTTGGHVIEDNWLMGAYVPVNCGGAPAQDLGRMWRNKFSGDSVAGSGGIPQTILLTATNVCDTGDGTPNQNVWASTGAGVTAGQPVLVRRNG